MRCRVTYVWGGYKYSVWQSVHGVRITMCMYMYLATCQCQLERTRTCAGHSTNFEYHEEGPVFSPAYRPRYDHRPHSQPCPSIIPWISLGGEPWDHSLHHNLWYAELLSVVLEICSRYPYSVRTIIRNVRSSLLIIRPYLVQIIAHTYPYTIVLVITQRPFQVTSQSLVP